MPKLSISNRDILTNTIDRLNKSEHTSEWRDKFEGLSEEEKLHILYGMMEVQSEYVIKGISEMRKMIPVYRIGKFYYKESRKRFYELSEKYPNKSKEEIVEILKKDHLDRQERKKEAKKGIIVFK